MSEGGQSNGSLSVSDSKLEILSFPVGLKEAWQEPFFCEAGGLVPDTDGLGWSVCGRSERGLPED